MPHLMLKSGSSLTQRPAQRAISTVGCAKSTSTTVLLFCRLSVPKTGPYVMCGRLRYVSHNFNRRPLKFTWELEDREALRGIDAFAEMVALK